MSDTARCSACGAEFSQGASPQGMCPACLLNLGLSSANIAAVEIPRSPRRVPWFGIAIAIVAMGVVAALTALFLVRRPAPADNRVYRFSVYPPQAAAFAESQDETDFAISPDGRRLVFTAVDREGKRLLWLHPFDSLTDQPLVATEGAAFPFWSPDSRSVGFFAHGKLKRLDTSDSVAQVLCDAPAGKGGTWNADNIILFAPNIAGAIYRVAAVGGTPQPVTSPDASHLEVASLRPDFLPDGRHFLYLMRGRAPENDGIFAGSLDSKDRKRLLSGRVPAVYANRHLVFIRDGMLLTQPFDPVRFEFSGEAKPVPFADHVQAFSVAENGALAYRQGTDAPKHLEWIDRSGKGLGRVDLDGVHQFSISPNGRALAVSRLGDIWVSDLQRDVTSRFTFDPAADTFPIWSPDGTRIAFLSNRGGATGIYQKPADGGRPEELLLNISNVESLDSWSPDGRFLVFTSRDEKGKSSLWLLPLVGERKPIALESTFNLRQGRASPDGRFLAYVSDESGKDEIFIEAFPDREGKWQVSSNGGTNPRWRPDGRELFFMSPVGVVMAVSVGRTLPSLELSTPRGLFSSRLGSYDLAADGRFLILSAGEEETSSAINIVTSPFF